MKTQTAQPSSLVSSPDLPRWRYDVFLSFYGKDTRKNFTAHLYTALKDRCIATFRDDEKLERGTYISQNLLQAIEESRYAIIVLSRNYASSRWCLVELVKIVECMENMRLKIFPIFLNVDPSHVRRLEDCFAEAFAKLEKDSNIVQEDVQTWKTALKKVGNISGWDLRDEDESTAIQGIVRLILSELNSRVPTVSKDLIGIDSRVKELENLCFNDRPGDAVHFVGILGMGGIGKTALARAFYDRFSSKFEASCFIADVRERTGKYGLNCLQNELLSHILLESNIDTKDVDGGKNIIRLRLPYKKVLVILDDVDQSEQLEALANERNWFGPGSSIIITTRDERLLKKHRLVENEICRAKELNNDEALCLFSWKAFKKEFPPEEFLELSEKILKYANGLPLALDVLGSLLQSEGSVSIWESALSRLKENPDKTIMKTLRISFDGLEETEKNIFLDIACFYKGKDSDRVKGILEGCGYHPKIGIKVLIRKSLITMRGRKLWMHDLLEEMGRAIVRCESLEDPGQRSRLWHDGDILHVLKSDSVSGTNKILGIFLNSAPQEELHLSSDVFSRMKNLRLLKISGNVHLSKGLSFLSSELRAIEWNGYPLKSLPMGFPPDKLIELNMHCSHIVQPWQGIKCLDKLILIDLSDSQYLIETPDFTGAPNLERLILQGCTKLCTLHSSVGFLRRLIFLNLGGCTSLTSLPSHVSWDSLKVLILSGCSRLRKFPEKVGNMNQLTQLDLDGIALEELPSSIVHFSGLTSLNLRGCKSLLRLPNAIRGLTSLKTLTLSGCSKLEKMPEDLGSLEHLEELDVSGTAIRQVPSSVLLPPNLKMLSFQGCSGLPPRSSLLGLLLTCLLPSSSFVGLLLPPSFSGLRNLNKLDLSYCHLTDGAVPDDLSCLSSLYSLDLSGNDFTLLPERCISQLSKLRFFFLRGCIRLRRIPALPSRIIDVMANDCISLETRSNELDGCFAKEIDFGLFTTRTEVERNIKASIDFARDILGNSEAATIPKWFQNQSMGSSISIPLHPTLDDSREWLGFALYFVFEIHDLESWASTRFGRYDIHSDREDSDQLEFHFETDEGPLQGKRVFHTFPIDTPAGYWTYVPRIWFEKMSNAVDIWTYIQVSITINSPLIEVKMCAARLVYKHNAQEFIDAVKSSKQTTLNICDGKGHSKISQSSPRSSNLSGVSKKYKSNPWGLRFYHVLSFPKNVGEVESSGSNLLDKGFISNEILECTSKTTGSCSVEDPGYIDSDSTIPLKKYLQSLLLRCYEANYAQNKMHKYVFPLSASPLWFTVHGMGPVVQVDLPPNLYDDKRWMGFAVYVSYVIRDQTNVSRNIFGHLDACDDDLECFFVFPPTPDAIIAGPSRLYLFHIPRAFFTEKLNQRSKIRASFGTNDQNMEVIVCGIRLVYEHDLKGLVQTIVGCVLRTPDIHRKSYLLSLKNQANNLPNYVYDQAVSSECNPISPGDNEWLPRFGYFSTERRNQFSEKFPSRSEELNDDLFEKCLTQIIIQTGASVDLNSNAIQTEATYLNEFCKGDPLKASLVNLVLNHLQDTHVNKFQPYNNCFLQCEIPEYFCCHDGSPFSFLLPQNSNNNSNWIGIALCVAFTVNKSNQPLIHNNLACSEIHLKCNLTSNTGVEMVILHSIITKFGNNSFIWLSYIPRAASFSESLNECDQMEAFFHSCSQDLIVQSCGHKFVYLDNMAELVGTIAQCAATCPHYSKLINNQFEGDQDRSNKQCRIDEEEETNESNYLNILNQKIRRCMKFLHNPRKEFHFFFASDHCFPPSEIPEFLTYRGIGPSLRIELHPNMLNYSKWSGLLICASFTFQENQIDQFLESLESGISHHLMCLLDTDIDSLRPIHVYCTANEELKWLRLHGFVWLFNIPIWWLPNRIKYSNYIEVSIMSDWPGCIVNNCGLRFLSTQDSGDFMQLLFHFQVSFFDNWGVFHEEIVEQDCAQLEPFSHQTEGCSSSKDLGLASANVESYPTLAENQSYNLETSTIFLKRKLETDMFSRLFEGFQNDYHGYFFPQGEIPSWFSNRNDGPSIEIQLPTNLYNNESWMGFVVCAVLGCPADSCNNPNTETPAGCILHLDSNEGCLKPDLVLSIPRSILLKSKQLLVVHYVSPTILPRKLNRWSHVKALVECNIPSVETQMCAIRLIYKQDVERFVQTTAECAVAIPIDQLCYYYLSYVNKLNILESRDIRAKSRERNFYTSHSPVIERRFRSLPKSPSICKREADRQCSSSKTFSNERVSESSASGSGVEIVLPPGYLDCTGDLVFSLKTDLEYFFRNGFKAFDPSCVFENCLPQTKVPEWFNHQSGGASVNIQLPPNIMNDRNWMGLALCAAFSVQNDRPTDLCNEDPDCNVSHNLICGLDTDLGALAPPFFTRTLEEKCMWSYLRGFLWLAYIPHRFLRPGLCNPCSQIKALFGSNAPKLSVQSCSLRLLYREDMDEFEQTIFKCCVPPFQYQNREVFHRNFEYSSCFLPCGITEWFSHHSNEPSVGFDLPPGLYNDSNWLGLTMCASFCVYEDDKDAHIKMLDLGNPHYLMCLLDTDIGIVEPLHSHRPFTEEEIMLVRGGEIMWVSYIPKGSLPEWLSQCTRMEASIASDCPCLKVHKCGFRLLYQHDVVEFKETVRHCNKQKYYNKLDEIRPDVHGPILPRDKGKQVVE